MEGGGKQFTEDSLLLLRGFDSIASSLSQLTNNLDAALQVNIFRYILYCTLPQGSGLVRNFTAWVCGCFP